MTMTTKRNRTTSEMRNERPQKKSNVHINTREDTALLKAMQRTAARTRQLHGWNELVAWCLFLSLCVPSSWSYAPALSIDLVSCMCVRGTNSASAFGYFAGALLRLRSLAFLCVADFKTQTEDTSKKQGKDRKIASL